MRASHPVFSSTEAILKRRHHDHDEPLPAEGRLPRNQAPRKWKVPRQRTSEASLQPQCHLVLCCVAHLLNRIPDAVLSLLFVPSAASESESAQARVNLLGLKHWQDLNFNPTGFHPFIIQLVQNPITNPNRIVNPSDPGFIMDWKEVWNRPFGGSVQCLLSFMVMIQIGKF